MTASRFLMSDALHFQKKLFTSHYIVLSTYMFTPIHYTVGNCRARVAMVIRITSAWQEFAVRNGTLLTQEPQQHALHHTIPDPPSAFLLACCFDSMAVCNYISFLVCICPCQCNCVGQAASLMQLHLGAVTPRRIKKQQIRSSEQRQNCVSTLMGYQMLVEHFHSDELFQAVLGKLIKTVAYKLITIPVKLLF